MYDIPGFGLWTDRLLAKLNRRGYRRAYVAEHIRTWIARQIKSLRESRNLSQANLGRACGKPQSAIARLENPDYGQMSLQTLLEIADAFDVALIVKFVNHETFLREYSNLSENALGASSFDLSRLQEQTAVSSGTSIFASEGAVLTSVTGESFEKNRTSILQGLRAQSFTGVATRLSSPPQPSNLSSNAGQALTVAH